MRAVCFSTVARSRSRALTLLMCAALLAGPSLFAAGASDAEPGASTRTTEAEPEYTNWIEFGIGGLSVNGDSAQFKQEHRMSGDVFGGIRDLHFEKAVGKNGLFSIDGHAIFDNDDYAVKMELSQPGLGYIRAGYTAFRSWYDGNGGFFPLNGQFFQPPFPEMHLDRGEAWAELGLRLPNWPEITLRYSHQFRDGQKDSTIWGDTTLTGPTTDQRARKIAPAYRDISETRDIFSLEAVQTFGNTDVGLGMRYERDSNDNRLQLQRGVGAANERFITQRERNTTDDLFSGHATTETRFSDSFWLTTANSYTTLGSDLAGSRIYGATYNAAYSDPITTLGGFDQGFLNLAGWTQLEQYVFNINAMWLPMKDLTVTTAFRYTWEDKQNDAVYLETSLRTIPPIPTAVNSWQTFNKLAQTLELRYTGIANWLFYLGADWEEESGDIRENTDADGAIESVSKNLDLFRQKYTAGFNWYPLDRLNISAQYYYKTLRYDSQSTANHQSLINQDIDTNDLNVRVTWRPQIPAKLGTLSLVTRYDFVTASVYGQWEVAQDPLQALRSALITSHMITESLTWNPLARLYVQGNLSYVWNKTDTPADFNFTPNTIPTVLDFTSDYWTANGAIGFALDSKTDLNVEYSYYRADNYVNNAVAGQPYGGGATEHSVSAGLSHDVSKNVRVLLKYTYFDYTDQTSGGFNNYKAHSVYSGLQFRF